MPPLLNPSAATFEKNLPPLLTPLYNTQVGTWQIVSDGQYSCGSSGASDIQLKFPDIASEHCRFVFEKLAFFLVRLKGRVWVNEIPVASEISLRQGDVISLGAFSFRVDVADPLAPTVTKGARHPQILGHIDSPNIQFVGHSDQRFTEAFPRNAGQNQRFSDAINSELQEQRELTLQREKEVRSKEESVQKTERQIRRFLTELEAMRSELSTEQWQLKKNRQSLASEREQLQQEWQKQRTEQDALETLRQHLSQTSQSDSAQRTQIEEQLRATELYIAQLEEKHRASELQAEQLAAQLLHASEELKQRTLATDELRNEILAIRTIEHAAADAKTENEHQLKTSLEQLEREWAAIDHLRKSQDQTRVELEAREDSFRIQQHSVERQEQELQQQRSEAAATQQALEALREELQREKTHFADQQQEHLTREVALQQQALAIEHQSAELQSLRQELDTLRLTVSRERSESQVVAEQLHIREKQLVDQQDDLVALQRKLHQQQEQLLQRVDLAAERETRLNLQEQTLALRQAQLELQCNSLPVDEHLQQLHFREQALVSREAELNAFEQTLQQQSTAFQNAEQKLQQQMAFSEERWNQLRSEESAVQARASEIAERLALWSTERRSRNAQLAEREQHLAQQLLDLQAGNATLKASQKEFVAQQQRLATASEQLEFRRQLLQEQHADLAAERDHAIAELSSSRVMVVELRQALEQARSANSRTAELKARLAEQDAIMNQRAESEAAARNALLKSQEEVERLTRIAAEAAQTQNSEVSDLQDVIDQRDLMIADLKHELQQSRLEVLQNVESQRRVNLLQTEHQITLQKQIQNAEKGLQDRDNLIRELRNHLATMSGRGPFAATLPNSPTESPEPLDTGTEDVISNVHSSDFYINLSGAQTGSVMSSHSQLHSSSSEDDDEFLRIDVGLPDDDHLTLYEQAASEPELQALGKPTGPPENADRTPHGGSMSFSNSQKSHLQTPGVLSAELIKLLEMDFQTDGMKVQDTDARGHTPDEPESPSFTDLADQGETTAESQGFAVADASKDSAASTLEREIADNEMQQYMDRLISNLRNPTPQRSGPQGEKTSRNTGFDSEFSQNKSASSAAEITGASGGKKSAVSYIDQYMSGQRSLDLEPDTESSIPVPQPPPLDKVEALQLTHGVTIYRPRANMQKLRDDMNSIRIMSTRFAEQAIVSHSLKQQQSGLLPRSAAVVASLAIIVWLKPYLLLWISFPQYVEWGTLGLLLLSCLELLRKFFVVLMVRFEQFAGDMKSRRSTVSGDRPDAKKQSRQDTAHDNGDAPLF